MGRYGALSSGTSEQFAYLCGDFRTFVRQATLGDSDDVIARHQEGGISGPVPLEGSTMMVEGEAVELGYEAGVRPQRVDLVVENENVGGWLWQAMLIAERKEAILKVGTGAGDVTSLGGNGADRLECAPAPTSLNDPLQFLPLEQSETVGFLAGSSKPRPIDDFGQVENSTRGRGDRNAFVDRQVLLLALAFVEGDALPTGPAVVSSHVHGGSLPAHEAP